jgi:hypothetical protein
MKVKELIEKLQAFDPEVLVVVDGYEDGVDHPKDPILVKINLNVNDEWYYGKHMVYTYDKSKNDCDAVHIPR